MDRKKLLIYFAHPKSHYNNEIEYECWEFIATSFDIFTNESEIFNPNQIYVDKHIKRLIDEGDENYFDFFRGIVKSCDVTVGVCFTDNVIGAGVYEEMSTALQAGKPTFLITFHDLGEGNIIKAISRVSSLNQLTVYDFLSIEDTRERIHAGVL